MNSKNNPLTIDIDTVLSTFPKICQKRISLSWALQSLDKRAKFGAIHFYEFQQCFSNHKLALERAGLEFTEPGNIYPNRTYYEARIYAFLHNLHAALDAFPYIAWTMLGAMEYSYQGKTTMIDERSCAWSMNFQNAMRRAYPDETRLHKMWNHFRKNQNFRILQALVNKSKHQNIVQIINDGEKVLFEEIDLPNPSESAATAKLENVDVAEFMTQSNNDLMPLLLGLIHELHEVRLRKHSTTAMLK